MDDLKQKIVGLVEGAGGSIAWQGLLDGLDYREQQKMTDAIRQLEGEGKVKRTVTPREGQRPLFTVDVVPATPVVPNVPTPTPPSVGGN